MIAGAAALVASVARLLALGGGALMLLAAVMTTFSVLGRRSGIGPVPGDFELVQLACGIGVLWFLPYCTLVRGHIVVESVTERLPAALRRALDVLGLLAFAALGGLLAATMAQGVADLWRAGTTTMVLQIPQVWAMAAGWLGALWLLPASLVAAHRLITRQPAR